MSGASPVEQQSDHPTTLDDVVAELQELRDRVDHLEEENEQLREERDALQDRLQSVEEDLGAQPEIELKGEHPLADLHIAGFPIGNRVKVLGDRQDCLTRLLTGEQAHAVDFEALPTEFNPLVESLGEVRAMRERYLTDKQEFKSEFAQLRRQLTHVSEETGVDLLNAIPGDDKVAKVVKDGVGSVVDGRIHTTHERAEKLLQNLEDWAAIRRDDQRVYAIYTSAVARDKLETARNESLQTTQVKRAFEKIAGWTDSSPRFCRIDKNKKGRWRLRLGVSIDQEDE